MGICFDKLPNELPNQIKLLPAGEYKGVIKKAEMKTPKDDRKPDYLSLIWTVKNTETGEEGTLFDKLFESDNQYMLYKLRSFMEAIGVNLGNNFELKDLCKVCTGKAAILNIRVNETQDPAQNEVNIFSHPYSALPDEGFMNVPEDVDDGIPFPVSNNATEPTETAAEADY